MPDSPSKDTKPSDPPPLPTSKSSTPRQPLPPSLQKIVDDNDSTSLFEQIYDGNASESTDSSLRYAAYATRLRTILLSAHRYVAYTSDVGESFRPVAHPGLIRTAYGISWAYLVGDVGHEGYKAYVRNRKTREEGGGKGDGGGKVAGMGVDDWRAVMAQRAVFQSVASMGLPAFTIHSIVRYSGRALKDAKNVRVRTYGPIGLGLAAVPFLPFIFDKPVEEATEWVFHKAFEVVGGHTPGRGKEKEL